MFSLLLDKIIEWLYPHKCTVFERYYSKNLKICTDCKKSYSLSDNTIKHQR